MLMDTWIDEMYKEASPKTEQQNTITLSDDELNKVADIMIKKMSTSADNSEDTKPTKKVDKKSTTETKPEDDDTETIIEDDE